MQNGGLVRRKPCRICGKFYRPNARVGDRQKTCLREGCRKAWRKRKNQEAYRKGRDYHRGHALREKLASETAKPERAKAAGSLQLPRQEIQEVMGAEAMVVLEYLLTLLSRSRRGNLW